MGSYNDAPLVDRLLSPSNVVTSELVPAAACLCFVPFHSCIIFPRVVLPALGRAAQSCWRSHQTPDGSRVISADEGNQAWENQSDIILESFEMTAEYNI